MTYLKAKFDKLLKEMSIKTPTRLVKLRLEEERPMIIPPGFKFRSINGGKNGKGEKNEQ